MHQQITKRGHKMQNLKSQNGRSMVEMLGVLAIIGVLSVGGVYGYGVAMKKHKANELLHQASMRASTVSSQILSGKTEGVISEFSANTNYGTFTQTVVPLVNLNQFELIIENVDIEVCNQMKQNIGEKSIPRMVDCMQMLDEKATATLVFNKDLSTLSYETPYKTKEECEEHNKVWCSATAKCVERDCCENQFVGPCQKCIEGTGAVSSSLMQGKPCDYQGTGDGICNNGVCSFSDDEKCFGENPTTCIIIDGSMRCCSSDEHCAGLSTTMIENNPCVKFDPSEGCTTNADCEFLDVCPDSNCFCYFSSSASPGTCQARVGDYAPSNPTNIIGLGTVVHGNKAMDESNSRNWCESMGKKLVNSSDIGCYKSGTSEPLNEEVGYCCAKGKTCGDWSTIGMWQEKAPETAFSSFFFIKTAWANANSVWKDVPYELTEEGLVLAQNYSPTIVDLRKKFGIDTSNQYNSYMVIGMPIDTIKGQLWGTPSTAYPLCH